MSEAGARPGDAATAWWRALRPRPDGSGGDRAALARLRRTATAMEAAMEPASIALCRKLGGGADTLLRAATVAAVLAHVRADVPGQPVARQLNPAMSELRFRRLIQARTTDEIIAAFRRAVALADHRLNVGDLAASLLDWTDARRRRWLYDYYNADSSPVPAGAPATETAP